MTDLDDSNRTGTPPPTRPRGDTWWDSAGGAVLLAGAVAFVAVVALGMRLWIG